VQKLIVLNPDIIINWISGGIDIPRATLKKMLSNNVILFEKKDHRGRSVFADHRHLGPDIFGQTHKPILYPAPGKKINNISNRAELAPDRFYA